MAEKPISYIRWHWAHYLSGRIAKRPAIEQALFAQVQARVMRGGGDWLPERRELIDIADSFRCDVSELRDAIANLLEREIIEQDDDGRLTIKFVVEQLGKMRETSQKRRAAAAARWDDASACETDAIASESMQVHASACADDANACENDAIASSLVREGEGVREKNNTTVVDVDLLPADAIAKKAVCDRWNAIAIATNLPKIRTIDSALYSQYRRRAAAEPQFWPLVEQELKQLDDYVFERNWMGFRWIVKSDANLAKLLEGNYRRKSASANMPDRPDNVPPTVWANLLAQAGGDPQTMLALVAQWRASK